MINIVLFGAPGCGKGTQAQRLKAHYGIEHVSTGEVIRDEIRRGTELGRSMESYIKAGKLAPDEIVIGMVANYVSEHKHVKGCIFDGFPRTTVQAEEFDKLLARHGLKVDIMVDIHVPEEELVRRILLRGKDSGRADDASEEVIRGRLDVYRQQTAVVSDYYAAQGKYGQRHGFDGRGLLAHHRRDRPVAIGTGGRPPKPGANPVPGFIFVPFPALPQGYRIHIPPLPAARAVADPPASGGRHAPALSPPGRPPSVHPGLLRPAPRQRNRLEDTAIKPKKRCAALLFYK